MHVQKVKITKVKKNVIKLKANLNYLYVISMYCIGPT